MYSQIGNLSITAIASTSVLQIGDSNNIDSLARVIAVQRQEEQYYGFEAPFSMYSIFSRKPKPLRIVNPSSLNRPSKNMVNSFDLKGLATSSVLHVGNSSHIRMVSRVKHIRQLENSSNDKE